jgi:hypothetical protein
MKFTSVHSAILGDSSSFDLLRFVRDNRPTKATLLDWLGPTEQGRYYVLLKAGLLLVEEGIVLWSPKYLAADGSMLAVEHMDYYIDEDTVGAIRRSMSKGDVDSP